MVYDGTRVVGSCTITAARRSVGRPHERRLRRSGRCPATAYDEALRVVLGELPDLPYLPELPGRGPHADMTGRALAVAADLGADLQPAGWRLTGSQGAAGVDHRRAVSLLAQDLDLVEELTQGYAGRFKVQVAGPWTLAATVERPRGDRVLADHGARRELAQALAEGLRAHVADVRRRVPGADLRRAGRRAGAARGAGRRGPDRVGLPPAPLGRRPRGGAGAGVGVLAAIADAGADAGGALLRRRRAVRPAASVRAPRASRSTSTCSPRRRTTRSRPLLEAGRPVFLGVVPVDRPGDRRRRRRR